MSERRPTSHELRAGASWDASYHDGPAPWDIGEAQPAIARLFAEGKFTGTVLDAGCGSGENALLIASRGLRVVGFDVAETALARARDKARERGIAVEFVAADALALTGVGTAFDTVVDCGLFHSFDADERTTYVENLASVTARGAMLYVLCFRAGAPDSGPHPLERHDLTAAFGERSGWNVVAIERDRVRTRFHGADGAPAWLATLARS